MIISDQASHLHPISEKVLIVPVNLNTMPSFVWSSFEWALCRGGGYVEKRHIEFKVSISYECKWMQSVCLHQGMGHFVIGSILVYRSNMAWMRAGIGGFLYISMLPPELLSMTRPNTNMSYIYVCVVYTHTQKHLMHSLTHYR